MDTEKEADKARKDSKLARDHFNDVKNGLDNGVCVYKMQLTTWATWTVYRTLVL